MSLKRFKIKTQEGNKWVGKSQNGYMLTKYKEQAREFDLSTANMLISRLEDQLKIKLELA